MPRDLAALPSNEYHQNRTFQDSLSNRTTWKTVLVLSRSKHQSKQIGWWSCISWGDLRDWFRAIWWNNARENNPFPTDWKNSPLQVPRYNWKGCYTANKNRCDIIPWKRWQSNCNDDKKDPWTSYHHPWNINSTKPPRDWGNCGPRETCMISQLGHGHCCRETKTGWIFSCHRCMWLPVICFMFVDLLHVPRSPFCSAHRPSQVSIWFALSRGLVPTCASLLVIPRDASRILPGETVGRGSGGTHFERLCAKTRDYSTAAVRKMHVSNAGFMTDPSHLKPESCALRNSPSYSLTQLAPIWLSVSFPELTTPNQGLYTDRTFQCRKARVATPS